ncbi:MAG TPA: hypothetical protein DDX14_07290, partial [Cyanobacteria bacterium UBA9579]|nr:hypothetical protein [Cyanobacteria bacterium UBA9579]
LALMPKPELEKLQIFIVSNNTKEALKLTEELRKKGLVADFDLANRKFGKQLEKASKSGVQFALILGEDEISTGTITVKNLETGEQERLEKSLALQKLDMFYNL